MDVATRGRQGKGRRKRCTADQQHQRGRGRSSYILRAACRPPASRATRPMGSLSWIMGGSGRNQTEVPEGWSWARGSRRLGHAKTVKLALFLTESKLQQPRPVCDSRIGTVEGLAGICREFPIETEGTVLGKVAWDGWHGRAGGCHAGIQTENTRYGPWGRAYCCPGRIMDQGDQGDAPDASAYAAAELKNATLIQATAEKGVAALAGLTSADPLVPGPLSPLVWPK